MKKKQLSHSTTTNVDSVDQTLEALRRLVVVLKEQLREVLTELHRLEREKRE